MATRKKTTKKAQPEKENTEEVSTPQVETNSSQAIIGTELQVQETKQSLKERLAGKQISINLKENTFYGVGPIWLNNETYWATIPHDLSNEEYRILAAGIRDNKIVFGKEFIVPIDKEEEKVYELCKELRSLNFADISAKMKFINKLKKIAEMPHYFGTSIPDLFDTLITEERNSKNRKISIDVLCSCRRIYRGPDKLYEQPSEREGIIALDR